MVGDGCKPSPTPTSPLQAMFAQGSHLCLAPPQLLVLPTLPFQPCPKSSLPNTPFVVAIAQWLPLQQGGYQHLEALHRCAVAPLRGSVGLGTLRPARFMLWQRSDCRSSPMDSPKSAGRNSFCNASSSGPM
eukprot:14971613-Ditylum_brightwellii.AAC.1